MKTIKFTKALSLLETHQKTCIVLDNNRIVFESEKHGVAPLIEFYNTNNQATNITVIDKIVGRGAVILAKLISAQQIITPIISADALSLAKHYNMDVLVKEVVPYIVNRNNNGRCPIESSVLGITNPREGYQIIIETLEALKNT